MRKLSLMILVPLFFSGYILYAQSPWVQPEQQIFCQLSFNVIPEYDELYAKQNSSFFPDRKLQDMTVQGYFEYGLLPGSSLLAVLPLKILKSGAESTKSGSIASIQSGTLMAPGNIKLGWRQQLYEQSFLISAQLFFEMPTAKYENKTGLRTGYDAWGVFPLISIGKGFSRHYLYGYLGFGQRTNNYSRLLNAGLEAGYRITDTYWLSIILDINNSLNDGSRTEEANNLSTGFYVNNQQWIAWGLKAFGDIIEKKIGATIAFYGAFSAHYVPKSPSIDLGLYYKF